MKKSIRHEILTDEDLTEEAIDNLARALVLRCKAVGVPEEVFYANMKTVWDGITFLGVVEEEQQMTKEEVEALNSVTEPKH